MGARARHGQRIRLGVSLVAGVLGLLFAGCGGGGGDVAGGEARAGAEVRVGFGAASPHWRSVDIKVDALPYADVPDRPEAFDELGDDALVDEKDYRVYVRVESAADVAVDDVRVTLYAGPATTMLPRLDDDGAGWKRVGVVEIARIDGGSAGIAAFEVRAPRGHQCLVATVDAPGQPGPALDVPVDLIAAKAGTMTARNMDFVGSKFERVLVVRNPTRSRGRATLEIVRPPDVDATLQGVEDRSLELAPGEQQEVALKVSAPEASGAEVTVEQRLELDDRTTLEGGITYVLRS